MRGTTGTLAREVPGNAIFFTVYEGLRQNLPGRPAREVSAGVLGILKDSASAVFCGGIAGMVPSFSPSTQVLSSDANCRCCVEGFPTASVRACAGDVDLRAPG